tara:strand:+ start:121 stop:603 length:483 start_codon:yes stop_codon:yes gene_type:complete
MSEAPISLKINLKVNGKNHSVEVPVYRTLVDLLRYDLDLTGTKETCGVGVCGACTVIMNGEMIASCITLAVKADGSDIQTIEGVAQNNQLHPIQTAFINHGGFQCGACTPGQIIAAKALLDVNPQPNQEEIRDWMMGNLCRCTGYYQIVEAITKVMSESR